jgi:hypothetical protein
VEEYVTFSMSQGCPYASCWGCVFALVFLPCDCYLTYVGSGALGDGFGSLLEGRPQYVEGKVIRTTTATKGIEKQGHDHPHVNFKGAVDFLLISSNNGQTRSTTQR